MAEEIKKVITIKVNGEKTVKDLKDNIKELQDTLVNLDTGTEDYEKTVNELIQKQAKLSEVMNAGKATVIGAAGSYNALKKEMADLKKVWAQLAPSAERDEVGRRINDLNDQLKKLDASTGNFQRNVGNYKNAFVSAFQAMGGATNGLISKVGNLSNMFQSFGKAGVVGIALAAAGGLISTISNGIKSSAENTIAWRKQLAQVKPLLDDLDALTERMGRGFLNLSQSLLNFFRFIGSGFNYNKTMGAANDEAAKAIELVDREIKNEEELQKLQLDEVTTQNRLNELRAIAADTDRKSYKERQDALRQIEFIETSLENRRINAAKEAYDIQVASRKGEKASLDEQKKERELWIEYQQAIANAQKAQIDREKELYQLQKDAGEEALDYRIRILESERNLLNTQISMVEANTIEEYNLRRQVADKEYEIAVATADKEKKNMTLKHKQLLEAEAKHYADLQQIEDDFTAGYLQRIKDQTDAAVANTVDEWKKAIPQLEGLLNEYQAKLRGGKPATQTTDEWEKELAQMREAVRKTWVNGFEDIIGAGVKKIEDDTRAKLKLWAQDSSQFIKSEAYGYHKFFKDLIAEKNEILGTLTQLDGETDEQFQERRLQAEKLYNEKIFELRKQSTEKYYQWYYRVNEEQAAAIMNETRETLEDFVKGIPHTVWDYLFLPTDNTMAQLENNLTNAESSFRVAAAVIEQVMAEVWDTTGENGEWTPDKWEEAFKMLPEDVQKDYLAKLEAFKDAEQVILQQRLDNWIGLGNAIGDLFGNVADIYEEDIKNRQKKGKIDEQQAKKEFENLKALQIAQAVINTLAGSVGAFLQASEAYPAPWGQIIGGVAAAGATAAGIAQIAKIKNTEYGGSSSVSSPSAQATPIVDMYQPEYVRNTTTASDVDTLNAGLERANLVVHVSEINDVQERGKVRVSESSW